LRLCLNCLQADARDMAFCPSCGGEAIATVAGDGGITTIPAGVGLPCQHCFQTARELAFRRYRRVTAYILGASVHDIAGYFCSDCRHRLFAARQGVTLLLGWWGILAMLVYNPWAILVNFAALFRPPASPIEWGALAADDLRAAAEEEEALDDLYASLPTWFTELSEEEIGLVLADIDYYAALEVSDSADAQEIKAAYRRLAKRYHPDSAEHGGDDNKMRALNTAYGVLSDDRLRYAYDHAPGVRERLADLDHSYATSGGTESASWDQEVPRRYICDRCGEVLDSLDDGRVHVDLFHPEIHALHSEQLLTEEKAQ